MDQAGRRLSLLEQLEQLDQRYKDDRSKIIEMELKLMGAEREKLLANIAYQELQFITMKQNLVLLDKNIAWGEEG